MSVSINGTTGLITAGASSSGGGGVATNTALGGDALVANTTGANNTAIGNEALEANTTASNNTAVGYQAGYNQTGANNSWFGIQAGLGSAGSSGTLNTGIGRFALYSVTSGASNTALGSGAMSSNTTGGFSVAVGRDALAANTTGEESVAVGNNALDAQTTGAYNTAVGFNSLTALTTGQVNTCVGYGAGSAITTSNGNTFIGAAAGSGVTTGANNTVIGRYNGNQGGLDIRTSDGFIVLSDGPGNPRLYITGSGNVNQLFCPAIYDWTTANAANVVVTGVSGHIVRSTSALKYKQDIRNLESIDINKFRPVRYKSKSQMDDQTKDHFGIIADEVAEAGITELVSYGADGEVEGFQYERLTVVLLKELQDLKKTVEAQALEIATLKGN